MSLLDIPGRYAKAIIGALIAGLTSTGAALSDNHITSTEWVAIALAVLGTSTGVGIAANTSKKSDAEQVVPPKASPEW